MKLFYEGELRSVLEHQRIQLKKEIEEQQQNYLLNANETELIEHFNDKYQLDPVVLLEDQIYASDREEMIPAERFDNFRFNVTPGNSYKKQVIRYHLPFTGDKDLLKYAPSTRLVWTREVPVTNTEIYYDIIVFSEDPTRIQNEWNEFLKPLKTQVGHSKDDVNAFNSRLEAEVIQLIKQRKEELLKKNNLLGSLGVPLKKNPEVPSTFSVPSPKKKVIVSKPSAPTAPFTPEPTLDDTTYNDILRILHDTGIEIERHPSIYEGKDEETLRDHLLMVLSPHFQSVSGETFNKSGKTDILIRHEGKNLFVAECANWKGAKQFLGKIDQLLSYLTWRDSKTAVICFVKNKDFANVLNTIEEQIPKHPCFLKDLGNQNEGWLRFQFKLSVDESRTVFLSVLVFHFP